MSAILTSYSHLRPITRPQSEALHDIRSRFALISFRPARTRQSDCRSFGEPMTVKIVVDALDKELVNCRLDL